MLKSLRIKLMLAGIGTLLLLLVGVWGLAWGHYALAGAMIVLTCFAVIALLLWFWRNVTDPIERLTDFADHIASGSYGSQIEGMGDDEIGQLAEAVNHISQQAAMAEKTRTEFISQVSHELRTPLTAITGWAETIAYDEAVQGDSLRGINIISREAERLTGMVMELLEFTRIQDGRFNLRIELLDISAELEDALFTYGELMRQAGVELNYTPSPVEIPLIPRREKGGRVDSPEGRRRPDHRPGLRSRDPGGGASPCEGKVLQGQLQEPGHRDRPCRV